MLGYKTSDSRGNVLPTSLLSQNVVHVYDIAAKSLYIICPAKGKNKEGLCFQKKFSRGLVTACGTFRQSSLSANLYRACTVFTAYLLNGMHTLQYGERKNIE